MITDIVMIDGDQWINRDSEFAHLSSFGEHRPASLEAIDFAIVSRANGIATGYVQCIEMDKETLYWQLGGAFSQSKLGLSVLPSYLAMIAWSLERYERITTRIENSNVKMLHLAMRAGFRVVGIWNFKNAIYLELLLERTENVERISA